ncbi:MAG: DUF86 domain-containing protein [Tildeniella nuda ZEHNDER 1965/U140]|nr:DUF86 domain-containing protein [Tildeniella nuda ZEHNDER 1965/U140]
MSEDGKYLSEIVNRMQRMQRYTQSGRTEFFQSTLIQDGVIRNFEVIGEAVKRLSSELKQTYLDIPWRLIAGFRDVLIHNFLGISLSSVWNAVEQDLPALKRAIELILQELDHEA